MTEQKRLDKFGGIMIGSIAIASIISVILTGLKGVVFILNENQSLYLFSTMAQVTGGLFGLTLTAYIFFADKFKESTYGDDILYDATRSILKKCFCNLILIGGVCGALILLCIVGIIDLNNWKIQNLFVVNEAVLLFVIIVVSILMFGLMLLDPNKLDIEVKHLKEEADKFYKSVSPKEGDFREFLKTYNMLEHLIIDFAKLCIKDKERYSRYYKPQIIQSLNVLQVNEILKCELTTEINELRMYRNALVHGVDFSIAQEVCDRIFKIYETLKGMYEAFQDKEQDPEKWKEAIGQMYDILNRQ